MINESLTVLSEALNKYLKSSLQINEDCTIVSNLIHLDGTPSEDISNKLVFCLVNIDFDPKGAQLGFNRVPGNSLEIDNSIQQMNIYVLMAANFKVYQESLKFLSETISFFHSHPVFTEANTSNMPSHLNKIIIEIVKTDFETSHHIWQSLGINYLPSIIYKLRILGTNSTNDLGLKPIINEPSL